MTWDVVVIGAGAAGLLAAIRAAEGGKRTLVLEKNDRPGVKILMSGGNRCNVTHATDRRGIVKAFGVQGNFLHSALAALGPEQVVQMLETEGVRTKVEETGKIFPASDRAADVLQAFLRRLTRSGAVLALQEPVSQLAVSEGTFAVTTSQRLLETHSVILTTGGMSYPACGTRGDGYAWASAFGHAIVPPRPALTPVVTDAAWIRELRGVTLPDVAVKVVPRLDGRTAEAEAGASGRKPLAVARGSLLFTHFGLSGPVVLDVSRAISGCARPGNTRLVLRSFSGRRGRDAQPLAG